MLTNEELDYFKDKLLTRKKQIEKNLNDTSIELKDMRKLELNDDGDIASALEGSTIDNAILEQQLKEFKEIEASLIKIENKTYGVCEMCEEPIGKKRLEVKNFAKYCITCREIVEKEGY